MTKTGLSWCLTEICFGVLSSYVNFPIGLATRLELWECIDQKNVPAQSVECNAADESKMIG